MSAEEYRGLAAAGCTGVTIYQETYDPVRYEQCHRWGPKRDYQHRLDAPARAMAGGIRTVGLGALLGLSDPLFDTLSLFRHASTCGASSGRRESRSPSPACGRSREATAPSSQSTRASWRGSSSPSGSACRTFRWCSPPARAAVSGTAWQAWAFRKMSVASRTTVGGYDDGSRPVRRPVRGAMTTATSSRSAPPRAKGLQPVFKNWDVYRAYREDPAPPAAPRHDPPAP